MFKKTLIAATAVAGTLLACNVSATLSIDTGANPTGPSYGEIPSQNETNDVLNGTWNGYYGGTVNADEAQTLQFTFIGYEANYTNSFRVKGNTEFTTAPGNQDGTITNPIGETANYGVDAGTVPFSFYVADTNESVTDGLNPDDNEDKAGDSPNFFLSFGNSDATQGDVLYVFLDDGGAENDDNHDDLVVKISDSVPEPGALMLLGIGLVGMGLAGSLGRPLRT